MSAKRNPRPADGYAPLFSVWTGEDRELLERMLVFYPTIEPEPILDATYNAGRFWKGSTRNVVSMDIDPQHKPMILADNRLMTGVPSKKFGTVVYDPPHVGPQGRDKSVKRFDLDFGATMACGREQGWTLSYLYPPFLEQAKRVLKPDGLLLAKITDMVNQPSLALGALRFYADGQGGRLHGLRPDREDSQRADDVEQMERGPPRPKATLLLDRVSQWGSVRAVSSLTVYVRRKRGQAPSPEPRYFKGRLNRGDGASPLLRLPTWRCITTWRE